MWRGITPPALALIVGLGVACSPPRGAITAWFAPGPSVLHVQTGDGITAIDAVSGTTKFALPGTIAAPGGARLFRAVHAAGNSRIEALRGDDASVVASHTVPGTREPVVASPRGRLVALEEPVTTDGQWLAPGREWSTLTIVDVEQGSHREYRLEGNYAPEAFSLRDDRLFVVEYLPAHAPERYRVRQLDLANGQVLPVGGRKDKGLVPTGATAVEEEMRGRSRMQVMNADHSRLYTLYLHDDEHVHRRDALTLGGTGRPNPDVHAFVHVLDLAEGWAFCLDLPEPFGLGRSEAHALALAPDGKRLFIVDTSSGRLAIADTEGLGIVDTHAINAGAPENNPASVLLRAGRGGAVALATAGRLAILDRRGQVRHQVALDEPVQGLEFTTDGRRVFALRETGLTVLDAATGEQSVVAVGGGRRSSSHAQ